MTREEMLKVLNEHGDGSDSNDTELMGWFDWQVVDNVLTVSFKPMKDDGDPGPEQAASWRLVADTP